MSVVLFFKQKTAYEMRISDWSSDVCSSYFEHAWPRHRAAATIDANPPHRCPEDATTMKVVIADDEPLARERLRMTLAEHPDLQLGAADGDGRAAPDRNGVGQGTSGTARGAHGGRRDNNKKNNYTTKN